MDPLGTPCNPPSLVMVGIMAVAVTKTTLLLPAAQEVVLPLQDYLYHGLCKTIRLP
jgi:hypothetical protein